MALAIITVSLLTILGLILSGSLVAQASAQTNNQLVVSVSNFSQANSSFPRLIANLVTNTNTTSETQGKLETQPGRPEHIYLPLIIKSFSTLPQTPVVVRLIYANSLNTPAEAQARLNSLAAWLDIWEVDPQTYTLIALVWPDEYAALVMAGYHIELDPGRTNQIYTLDNSCYRTVEQLYATLAQTVTTNYPGITRLVDYGDSWEKKTPGGKDGYNLYALEITNKAISGRKPVAVIDGGVHAREMTPPEVALALIDFLTSNYNRDPDVTWLVDYHKIVVPLMMNPDGRKHAELGELWRKNTDSGNSCSNLTTLGTDLNRNFDFKWNCCGGSSGNPCSSDYRGPAPLFEPETNAYATYLRSLIPDQWNYTNALTSSAPITASGILINLHSYDPSILYPWGWTENSAPNDAALKAIANKFATFNNYPVKRSLYRVDGTIRDWGYGDLGIPSFTFEMGSDFFQSCSDLPGIINDNLPALYYGIRIARTPYKLIYGPDVSSLTFTTPSTTPGSTAQLNATINDNRNGQQGIAGAIYYIDTPPWLTATTSISYPMTVIDGAFNEVVEEVQAELDLTNLAVGKHTIFVQGLDANGNWGPFWATWLTINQSWLSGSVFDGKTNAPISNAQLTLTNPSQIYTTQTNSSGNFALAVLNSVYSITTTAAGYYSSTLEGIVTQANSTTTLQINLTSLQAINPNYSNYLPLIFKK